MRVRLVPRRARGAALTAAVTALAAGCLAGPAMAADSTISIANDTTTPEQAVPVDFTLSGSNASASAAEVDAIVRPAGGHACLSTYQEDTTTFPGEDMTIVAPSADPVASGAGYQFAAAYNPPSPGDYQVCAWLDAGSGTGTLAGPETATFTAVGPQVGQLSVTVPKTLTPNVAFQIGYTTQTDQQLELFSVLQSASQAPCASSFELDQQQHRPETTLLGIGSSQIFGGPVTSTATTKQSTGSYIICTWIEGPNASEVDDSNTTAITVGTPVVSLPKPGLKLTRASASRRHGVSLAGSVVSGFAGRLSVVAACGRASSRRTTTAGKRRFSATIGLPRGCSTAGKVKLTVSFAGSHTYAKQSVSRSVAIRR